MTATASDGDGADPTKEEPPYRREIIPAITLGESVLHGALFRFLSQSSNQSTETPLPGVEIFQVIDASVRELVGLDREQKRSPDAERPGRERGSFEESNHMESERRRATIEKRM